jgi:parvulin-like peptidyl-prolyl isomerase
LSLRKQGRLQLSLALTLSCIGLLGCGKSKRVEGEIVAEVVGEGQRLALDRRVVEQLAAREGIDEDQARAQALDTLRLVAARRAELAAREPPPEHEDDLDPARREYLERAALVRLWLDEVFEPANEAADIPQKIVDQNMADPALTRRIFHPELDFVCQALIVPARKAEGRHAKPPSEPEAAARWRAAASAAFAPLVARARELEPDLIRDGDCSLLGRIVGASERAFESEAGPLALRFERFAFAPSTAESFDPEWVEAVTARTEPGIVGPFATQFGLHLVVIGKIEPARLADGSLPPEELQTRREGALREEIEEAWRADRLQQTLIELGDRRVVRLAPELEREQ